MVSPVAALALLLITPYDASMLDAQSCIKESFYGMYRDGPVMQSVLIPEQSCLDLWSAHTLAQSASIAEASREIQSLVWVEHADVDPALLAQTASLRNEFDSFLEQLSPQIRAPETSEQNVLSPPTYSGYELLYRTPNAALLSVSTDTARTIDTLLPRFWKSSILPSSPVQFRDVDTHAIEYLKHTRGNLTFDPVVASVVESISIPQMRNDIRFLSGEDPISGIISRHSFSDGALTAASWLKDRFEATGATCELWPFLQGFAPNVLW